MYYIPYVSLGQSKTTNKRKAIDKIAKVFGGSIYEYQSKSKSNKLDVIQWCITSEAAYKMVKTIKPYLLVRKSQAEILIEFYEKFMTQPFHRISGKEQKQRAGFFERMRQHNVRGKLRYQKRLSEEAPNGDATV